MQERNGDQRKKGVDGLAPTGKGEKSMPHTLRASRKNRE